MGLKRLIFLSLVLGGVSVATNAVHAALPVPPKWVRPTNDDEATGSRSTYQAWTTFSLAAGSAATVDINPRGTPNAYDALKPTSGSGVTSSGALYAPTSTSGGDGKMLVKVDVPSYGDPTATSTKFLLQITSNTHPVFVDPTATQTWGLVGAPPPPAPPVTETVFNNLKVTANNLPAIVNVSELPSFVHNSGAFTKNSPDNANSTSWRHERSFEFELPGNASLYTIEWPTLFKSTAISEIAVDTLAVPEPASAGLVALAAAAVGLRRRRRA